MPGENKPDSRGLQFIEINDFSPGIYDNNLLVGAGILNPPGPFPAPAGAADATYTQGCMSLAGGGLGPGPALGGSPGSSGLSPSAMGITFSGSGDILALTNSFQSNLDELIIGVNVPGASTQITTFYSYVVGANSLNTIYGPQTNNYTTNRKNYCAYPGHTQMSYLGLDQPFVVLPLSTPDGGATIGPLLLYPNWTANTAFGCGSLANHFGIGFEHQGRVGLIEINTTYGWPVSVTEQPPELFGYTDPSGTISYSVRGEVFGPENPFGYGAVSSVSAGELFCIKRRGGGVMIQGDLNNPTVTSLPAVQSTGPITGRTDVDQNGMYYCSEDQGAWLWNGGNSSQKISQQLDDGFYKVLNPISNTTFYGFYCQRWDDWMLFSNNYVYNTTTGGWWKLMPNSATSFFWYVPAYDNRYMFACKPVASTDTQAVLFEFDRTIPTQSYEWQSLPLRFPTEDRQARVEELVIRATNPYGDSAPQIAISLVDDQGNTTTPGNSGGVWTIPTVDDTVQETRMNCRLDSTTVAVNLQPSGTLYAPVVVSVGIGYRSRQHVSLA